MKEIVFDPNNPFEEFKDEVREIVGEALLAMVMRGGGDADTLAADAMSAAQDVVNLLGARITDAQQQYHDDAMRTAAPPTVFHWDGEAVLYGLCDLRPEYCTDENRDEQQQIVEAEFATDVIKFIEAAQKLDSWKSALFYNKAKTHFAIEKGDLLNYSFENIGANYPLAIHALLGLATEPAELLEDLLKLMQVHPHGDPGALVGEFEDRASVKANMSRETGDIDWYQELLASWLGVPVSQSRRDNIDRLRKRFPDKFSEADAVARADEASEFDPRDYEAILDKAVSRPTIERRSDD